MSGHPALRPAGAVYYVSLSACLEEAERALHLALVTTVTGNHTRVSAELTVRFRLWPDAFSVHRRRAGEFLLRFSNEAIRAQVTAAPFRATRFRLILHPWSRLAGGEPVSLHIRVDIEIRGIPKHGWDISSPVQLLSPFCLVDHLAPKTLDESDLETFCLTAWTGNHDAIPRTWSSSSPSPMSVRMLTPKWP